MNIKEFKISIFLKNILLLNFLILLLGYIIIQTIGVKIHYFIFILSSLIILGTCILYNAKPPILKITYLLYLTFLIVVSIAKNGVDATFLFTVVVYLFIPIVFYRSLFSDFNLLNFLNLFRLVNIFYAVGLLLQLVGKESILLDSQFTYTMGELQYRFGSFAGSSLLLGFVACVLLILSFFSYIHKKQKRSVNLIFICLGIFNLLVSQSRRFYIFIFFTICLMFLFKSVAKSKTKLHKYIFGLIVVISLVSIFLTVFGDNYFMNRLVSVFDFKNDSSNSLRIFMWINAINNFINNFWLGTGLGSTTVAGKDIWNQVDSIEDIVTTESYMLKNFVEGGVVFGLFFLNVIFRQLTKGFNAIKTMPSSNKALAGYFIIFFFLDSIVGTTLESIISSVIFWISVSILSIKKSEEAIN